VNVYGFVGNGPIDSWDFLGLAKLEDVMDLLSAIRTAKVTCRNCCPKVREYLKCMDAGVIGDNQDLVDALDELAADIAQANSRLGTVKTRADQLAYLQDVFGKQIVEDLKLQNTSTLLGKAGDIFGYISTTSKLGASISRGDALDFLLVAGAEFAPKGVGDMLGFYSEAYRTALKMIGEIPYKGSRADIIRKASKIFLPDDCESAELSLRSGFNDPWDCYKKLK
jgi:hypothetical protein